MRTIITAALLLLAGSALDGLRADPYRWCAHYGGWRGGGGVNCYFVTLAQCQAAISGVGGTCQPNPFYDGRPVRTPEDPVPRRQKRRAY